MLRVSKSEYLFDPLQRLLSPSVVNRRAWSHRRLLRSMQRGTRIKSCTKRLIPLMDPPFTDPLAVKLLDNQLFISLSLFLNTNVKSQIKKLVGTVEQTGGYNYYIKGKKKIPARQTRCTTIQLNQQ